MKGVTCAVVCLLFAWAENARAQSWDFRVLLDGKPIGSHRYEVLTQGEHRTVHSQAELVVKLLGLTVYGYQHRAREHWQGECLRALHSTTDDDGKQLKVALDEDELPACLMRYAYWNPRLLQQTRLVNAQTGSIDAVSITVMGSDRIEVRGAEVNAVRWRITGLPSPIDLWYAPAPDREHGVGAWLGLDSRTNGRLLSYRLQ